MSEGVSELPRMRRKGPHIEFECYDAVVLGKTYGSSPSNALTPPPRQGGVQNPEIPTSKYRL